MLTTSDIRKLANNNSYLRGTDIYKKGMVSDFGVEGQDEQDFISAYVKGSGRNIYNVDIVYDTAEDSILEGSCDCPAFYSYDGACKHCVAVLLKYAEHKGKEDRNYIENYIQNKIKATPKAMSTTPEMKRLLSKQATKRTAPILQSDTYGKVRVEPYLECNEHQITLEFKIGVSHMYVLKDIFGFSENMIQSKEVSYGQKLSFVHVLDAFEPDSKPIVQFILNWTRRHGNQYIQYSYRRGYYGEEYGKYDYSFQKLRTMPLQTEDLELFLEVIRDQGVSANVNYTGDQRWFFTKEHLHRRVDVVGQKNGIEVSITHLFGYGCSTCNIYFVDGLIYKVPFSEIAPINDFLICMADIPSRSAFIEKEDVPLFCRELLPLLETHYECHKTNFHESDYGLCQVAFEMYLDAPERDFVTGKIMAVYGEDKYNVFDTDSGQNMRDLIRELEVRNVVSSYFNAFDNKAQLLALAGDEDKLYELLVHGITKMQEVGEVFISESMKPMKVSSAPSVAVGVSLSGEMLELTMTSADISREQLIEILSKYNRKKKFYRFKNGDFVNVEGGSINALLELKEGLNITDKQLKKETLALPKYRALYLDAELKEWQALPAQKDKPFKALVRNMKTVEDNDFEIPSSLSDTLREYQKRGFLWLKTLKHNGFGGILADDMGLGKTLQVIAFLLSEQIEETAQRNKRCLIVSPASLVFNWYSEVDKFAPSLSKKMVIGTVSERKQIIEQSTEEDILITSYDLLKRDMEHYEGMGFAYQVIDEAQYIKNQSTLSAKSVKEIEAGCKFALTGTPVENRLSELWSIFDYLMPGFLYMYPKFKEEIETPIVQNGDEKALQRLQKMIQPFVLRRLKKDVLTDLPDKIEENMYAKLEGEQQKLYDAHVKRLQMMLDKQSDEEFRTSKIQLLAELTKLRQICCHPALLFDGYQENSGKMELCFDLIQNAVNGGHKILLFSQFTSMLEIITDKLDKENISFYTLTGATSKEKRKKLVDDFNQDDTSVFCISLKAGGTGLNLTAADIVIHYDPWWNIAVQNQATDRAHRIGQTNVVTVYRLLVKGTIEDNITSLQNRKRELADQVLSGEGLGSGSFTREEILSLLGTYT